MENLGTYSFLQNAKQVTGYTVSETVHQEKKHLIVPVIMIVEGVLNGSHGPLYHPVEEFGKFPESWNGIPVVINHPESDGHAISANSPEVVDNLAVGRVYNCQVVSNKLTGEVWLEEEKLGKVSADTLSAVNSKKPIEISVGVFTEDEATPGVYDGIQYTAIARNHRPDHLALLPGAVGACSLEDGCGIRANQKKGELNVEKVTLDSSIQVLKEGGYKISTIVDNSEKGLNEKLDQLRDLVRSLNVYVDGGTDNAWYYLIEAYDDYLIYEKEGNSECKYYKQNYQFVVDSGAAEFVGNAVEVKKKVEYETINTNVKRVRTNKKETSSMACTPCVEKKANELIANSATGFTEDDRDMLQALTEKQLDALVPKTIEVNAAMSAEDTKALEFGKAELAKKRSTYISGIQKNTAADLWPEATLNAMDEDTLERVFKSVSKEEEVDFSLNGNATSLNANKGKGGPEHMLPTGMELGN